MKKIFIIQKFVAAENLTEAIEADKNTPVHSCCLDEHSQKLFSESLIEEQGAGFKKK